METISSQCQFSPLMSLRNYKMKSQRMKGKGGEKAGCSKDKDDIWKSNDERFVLPDSMLLQMAKNTCMDLHLWDVME